MVPNWEKKILGDVITLHRGYDLPSQKREKGRIPIISSAGVCGFHNEVKIMAPGVVTGRYGTLGQVFFMSTDFWPLNTTLYVSDFKGNSPRFIAYLLQTLHLETRSVASAVPGLDRNALHLLPVTIPSIPEQIKIASILTTYDDLIENNSRRIKILEEMADTIYREWFVYFRFPGYEDFPLVESEFGLIPDGWEHNFPDFVDFLEGPGIRNWQYKEVGIPFLNIRTMQKNDIDFSKVNYLDKDFVYSHYKHFLLNAGDHVVSSSGTIGRIVTIQEYHLPLMINTSIIRMRPKKMSLQKWQLKHFLLSDFFQNQIQAFATGAAQKNFGPMHLNQMKIISPNPEIGLAYEKLVEPLEKEIGILVRKNNILKAQRDLLLPKLISGEIEV